MINFITVLLCTYICVSIVFKSGYLFWLITKALDTSQSGIVSKDIIRIGRFQHNDVNPPEDCEQLGKCNFFIETRKPGKYGGFRNDHKMGIYTCPKCKSQHTMTFEHGDTIRCKCGLYAQTHGNRLDVWT